MGSECQTECRLDRDCLEFYPDITDGSRNSCNLLILLGDPSPHSWVVASLDLVIYIRSCRTQCAVARSIHTLTLEQAKKAFAGRVVNVMPRRAH